METIVLRSKKQRSAFIPVSSINHEVGEIEVAMEDWDATDIRRAEGDKNIVGHAPSMPVHLIRALGSPREIGGKPPGVSWGVKAVRGTESPFTGAGVAVAVLDTGIDIKHSAFKDRELHIVTRNFTSDGEEDTDGHGTHCAGTIFGRDTQGCRIGVARGVKKALIGKVLGTRGGSTGVIARAIHWAWGEGAQIISMSLGVDYPKYREALLPDYPAEVATSLALAAYCANVRIFDKLSHFLRPTAGLQGAIVVAASGNESRRDMNPKYRIAIAPPAAAEFFLGIGAVQQSVGRGKLSLEVAPFSNTAPRLTAPGVGIWSAALGDGLKAADGTSTATPHVAGVAALWTEKFLRQGRPFDASEVVRQIESAALELPNVSFEDGGVGFVQAPCS